jgi:AraC family transcriptional regulator
MTKPGMTKTVALEVFVGPAVHAHARGDVTVHESPFTTALVIPAHVHDQPVISLMLGGAAAETIDRNKRDLVGQDLLFTPAFEQHAYTFHEDGRWLNMQYSPQWLSRVCDRTLELPASSRLIRNQSAVAWANRVRAEVREPDSVSSMAIDGAMILMLAEIARVRADDESTRPRWLRTVEEAIDTYIGEPPATEALAALAGVHPSHLLRVFRKYNKTTISNFVRRRRIELARNQVAMGKIPLAVIALNAGFADQSHFTRVFRKAFGETPGQYARSLRRK